MHRYCRFIAAATLLIITAGCGGDRTGTPEDAPTADSAPGLEIRTLRNGYGRSAKAGDYVTVDYTGWIYDESQPDNRGEKFDSSIDRGDRFRFELGAGRVIRGWDLGVEGMLIGETRELTIAPELAYGDRGAGRVIPPGATLVFEIELFDAKAPGEQE